MTSEWLKVMLDEIARKKDDAEQARLEEQARREEQVRGEENAGRQDTVRHQEL